MIPVQRHYLVIGSGVVGQAMASFLHQAGHRVAILADGDLADHLATCGIQRSGVLGEHHVPRDELEVVSSLDDLRTALFDAIFVCVKSSASVGIRKELHSRPWLFQTSTPIVLCQGGWGHAGIFEQEFLAESILYAVMFTGFTLCGPHHVQVMGHAQPLRIGNLSGGYTRAARTIITVLTAGGLPAEASAWIDRDLWEKQVFDCTMKPLGAIFGVSLGVLDASRDMRAVIRGFVEEAYAVMWAKGASTYAPDPEGYLRQLLTAMANRLAIQPSLN